MTVMVRDSGCGLEVVVLVGACAMMIGVMVVVMIMMVVTVSMITAVIRWQMDMMFPQDVRQGEIYQDTNKGNDTHQPSIDLMQRCRPSTSRFCGGGFIRIIDRDNRHVIDPYDRLVGQANTNTE